MQPKIAFKEAVARQTRSPMRSILSVCEQSGYRSLTQQTLLKNNFYPKKARRIPAAPADPTTPATLGPIACIRRKFDLSYS